LNPINTSTNQHINKSTNLSAMRWAKPGWQVNKSSNKKHRTSNLPAMHWAKPGRQAPNNE
jgi:hypothetical protein